MTVASHKSCLLENLTIEKNRVCYLKVMNIRLGEKNFNISMFIQIILWTLSIHIEDRNKPESHIYSQYLFTEKKKKMW